MNPNTLYQEVLGHSEIEQLIVMRQTQKSLKERLALLDESIDKTEKELIALVDAGGNLAITGYEISVQEVVRRYPAWKEHFISRLGKAEADAVLEATSPIIHRRLVIK